MAKVMTMMTANWMYAAVGKGDPFSGRRGRQGVYLGEIEKGEQGGQTIDDVDSPIDLTEDFFGNRCVWHTQDCSRGEGWRGRGEAAMT